jgi:hypothetical protein
MMSKAEIYECFKNVKFGEPFRTVQEVRIWSDHADADIKMSVTENPAHDCIRKLDACLHMFGAIASRLALEVDDSEGAFLPNFSAVKIYLPKTLPSINISNLLALVGNSLEEECERGIGGW